MAAGSTLAKSTSEDVSSTGLMSARDGAVSLLRSRYRKAASPLDARR